MIDTSDRFQAAIRQAHTIAVSVSLFHPDDLATAIDVDVVGGTFTADRDARVRRQASVDIPFEMADPFTRSLARALPYGGYATVSRGVKFPDGDVELVQLGRFRVDAVSWGDFEGVCTLTLSDRMAQVQDEALVAPFAPLGLHPSDACVDLIEAVFGSSILYHVETSAASEPVIGDAVYVDDRAAAVSDLAAANAWAFFDNLGDFVLRPRGNPEESDSWLAANETGSLLDSEESLDRSNVRNGVLVRGQATADAPPVSALATHDDAASPLRWGGPFGHVPLIVDSQSVATTAAAQDLADSMLRLRLGLSRTVVLHAVPNPAIEPDDVIDVNFADGRFEQHLVNGITIGLGPQGVMDVTATSLLAAPVLAAPARLIGRAGHLAWQEPVG
jgi:hypothetical protein